MAEETGLSQAIARVHDDLNNVRQIKKCASCECLLDVLQALQTDLEGIDVPESAAARADFQRWLGTGNVRRHGCLGCEVCLPTEPYNRFSALLRESGNNTPALPESEVSEEPECGCGGT